jgi:chemotaxis methyl-accepting protein methylase
MTAEHPGDSARSLLDAGQRERLLLRLKRSRRDFSRYRLSTVEQRFLRRMSQRGSDSIDAYLAFLEASGEELDKLCADLRIGVTSFFRDEHPFQMLKQTVLTRAAKAETQQPVRIWTAGCSTGEEAYSLVMCWLEIAQLHGCKRKLEVFATDVDRAALAQARLGIYSSAAARGLSEHRLAQFFVPNSENYQVRREVREHILFATHDLVRDPPFARLDLISCRNVLMYFDSDAQRQVRRKLHYALAERGSLLLGTSESVGSDAELFSVLEASSSLYTKRAAPHLTVRWNTRPDLAPRHASALSSSNEQDSEADGNPDDGALRRALEHAQKELAGVRHELQHTRGALRDAVQSLAAIEMENHALCQELMLRTMPWPRSGRSDQHDSQRLGQDQTRTTARQPDANRRTKES